MCILKTFTSQARLAAKVERKAEAEDRLRRALYPQPDDIINNRKELQKTMEEAKMQRSQTIQAQREADERWGRPLAPDPAGQSWKVTGLDVGYQVRGFLLYTNAEIYKLT